LYKRHRYYIKKVNEKREGFHPEYWKGNIE
jgi:hypothetical protein